MKNLFRQIIGFGVVGPIVLMILVSTPFMGKQKAIEFWGPCFTFIAKLSLKWQFIPKIENATEFDLFQSNGQKIFQVHVQIVEL